MYTLGIYIYILFIRVAALFGHNKAKKKLAGHREIFPTLGMKHKDGERYVWVHVSSRGGFEQCRPLIEQLHAGHPEYRIVLTFFSPFGYEMAKNYQLADVVCFIPFDVPRHVRRFLDVLRPEMVFFVKCEFWQNFLAELKRRSVPVYSVSAVFRNRYRMMNLFPGAVRRLLHCFEHLFVQDEHSKELLEQVGVKNVTVAGNTRFDRVVKVLEQAPQLPLLEAFADGCQLMVAGCSEKEDELVYMPFFNEHRDCKLIIAPNEFDDERLKAIENLYEGSVVRYSRASLEDVRVAGCMIMDCCGLLSSVYRYGTVAYVGGGFGHGVHNVIEAAVYGIPVIIGPKNSHSNEVQNLKMCGGTVEVADASCFAKELGHLLGCCECREKTGDAARRYVQSKAGATAVVLEKTGL